ncbi:MAG: type III secretion protein [Planctomycetota bacterium]|jgi:hypothetical protein|nr:type III secretion protein [Planctomycetota bacterium]
MARYPLEPLLVARRYREAAAARETLLARRRVEEAREAEAAAREKLLRYREWRPAEENRLFGTVRGRAIPREDLDRHLEDVRALRRAELNLEDACREAEKAVAARMGELDEAKRRQADAVRDLRKMDAHRDIWRKEEARRLELAEEAELEDFSGARSDMAGDDGEDY